LAFDPREMAWWAFGANVKEEPGVDPQKEVRGAARAAAHASLTRSSGPLTSAPRGTPGDVHALHSLVWGTMGG